MWKIPWPRTRMYWASARASRFMVAASLCSVITRYPIPDGQVWNMLAAWSFQAFSSLGRHSPQPQPSQSGCQVYPVWLLLEKNVINGELAHMGVGLSLDAEVFLDADGVTGLVEYEVSAADPVLGAGEGQVALGDVGPPRVANRVDATDLDMGTGGDEVPRSPAAGRVAVGGAGPLGLALAL